MSFARSALANRFSALVLTAATATLALPLAAAPGVEGSLSAVQGNARVAKALEALRADDGRTFTEQKHIAQIPAPPFKEKVRAEYYLKRFQELGLKDASIAPEGYVIATRKGSGQGPQLVVSAHLDTVFPEGTDLTLKEQDGKTYGPGIGDDARGLAALLSVIDALNKSGIETVGDLVFVGTVGEEELGNLRGVKALFKDRQGIDGFISVDGIDVRRIVNRGTGSHRYEMTFKGPGGHSFAEFGRPSAIHAMGRAIAKIAEVRPPKEPKTTFTVGTVQGGTSVNAIAGEARLTLDMRSNEEAALLAEEKEILALVQDAVKEENKRWDTDQISVDIKLIGDRPAGGTAEDSPMVQTAQRAIAAVTNGAKVTLSGGSTDSNTAMSLGVPAMTISGGGEGGSAHSLAEWYKPVDAYQGPQNVLLTSLTLVGVKGVSEPVLQAKGK